MPLVRMLTSVAGSGTSPTWEIGEEVDMTPEQAQIWADGERGELVREPAAETPEGRSVAMETTSRRGPGRPRKQQ
jgi:hypothetical protein